MEFTHASSGGHKRASVFGPHEFMGPNAIPIDIVDLSGSDPQAVKAIITDVEAGFIRVTGGDADPGAGDEHNVAVNGEAMASGRHWRADRGYMYTEAIISNNTNILARSIFFGYTDTAALELPATIASTDVITLVGTDFAGFLYDTVAGTGRWFVISANAGTANTANGVLPDVTQQYSATPIAGTPQHFRVGIDHRGNAQFWIDGNQVREHSAAIATSVLMSSYVIIDNAESGDTTSPIMDVHYWYGEGYPQHRVF